MINLKNDNKGSFTLEAVVIFPFFLVFLIALINFINVTMVYIAMEHAVGETAKLIAGHSFPLKDAGAAASMAIGELSGAPKDVSVEQILAGSLSGQQFIAYFGQQVLDKTLQSATPKGVSLVSEYLIRDLVEKKVIEYYPLKNLKKEDFRLTEVRAFSQSENSRVNGVDTGAEDVVIVVVYSVKIPIPFLPLQEVVLTSTAVERAWADG